MKRILVTGSSRGIGRAVVEHILRTKDWEVIGTSTSGENSIIHERFKNLPLNLSMPVSIDSFLESTAGSSFHYLINNAGVLLDSAGPGIDFDILDATFRINLFGTIRLTEGLVPHIPPGGHIINISS